MSLASSSFSRRSISPHKKSKRTDFLEMDQALANLSPRKRSKRVDDSKFERVRSEEDSFELDMKIQNAVEAKVNRVLWHRRLWNLPSKLEPLEDRVVKVEKRLDLHEKVLDQVVDVTGKLQESNRSNESRIEEIMLKMEEITQSQQNHQQRLSKLEEGALVSGRRVKRGKRRNCSFCAKDLSANYLRNHQKKYCKKAVSNNGQANLLAATLSELTAQFN